MPEFHAVEIAEQEDGTWTNEQEDPEFGWAPTIEAAWGWWFEPQYERCQAWKVVLATEER